jgi:hypothetical protein
VSLSLFIELSGNIFDTAIMHHNEDDIDMRDEEAKNIINTMAEEQGFDISLLDTPDYEKLCKYAVLFTIMLSN